MESSMSCQAILGRDFTGIRCVAISPDGQILAGGRCNGTIQLWRLTDGNELATIAGHTREVTCVAMSPDGRMLASGSLDGTIRLWSLPAGTALKKLESRHYDFAGKRDIAFSSDGCFLANAGSVLEEDISAFSPGALRYMHNAIFIWRLPQGTLNHTMRWDRTLVDDAFNDVFAEDTCVTFSPDLHTVVRGKCDGTVRVLGGGGFASQMIADPLARHRYAVTCIAFRPDKRLLVTGGRDTTIRVWSWTNHEGTVHILEGHSAGVSCITVSSDGRIAASGSKDTTIRLWGMPNGATLQILEGHTREVTSVAMNPDGRVLASGSLDGTIRLWTV